ncbi:MAG TPA: cupin domain-containing protein [Burkholderiales bacterium]|nr:cupin domain-containing protein [Burkholderiales bacterium]
MAVHFNESTVAKVPFGTRAERQTLLTKANVPGTSILLDRWTLSAGALAELVVPRGSMAWFFMLEGACTLQDGKSERVLSEAHTGFFAPGYRGALKSGADTILLYVEVPDAIRFDASLAGRAPEALVVDWTREPVLQSQHDARKRIYVATPKLFGTTAFKAEVIVYPPGTSGSNHHHVGCEHFKYIISGKGTGYTNEEPHGLAAGDLVYHYDLERHYSHTEGSEVLRFIEFFVPGKFETVWVDESRVCAWLPSGKNIQGGKPVREIKAHSSADFASAQDV